jgi:hypothetical protein
MNEIDDDYVFHPNGDCDCNHSFNYPHFEEIIYRRSFFDIDTSGSQFLNHEDCIVDGNSSQLILPPEEFNFPPGYRRVVHVDEVLGDHRTILGTGSALPEMFEKDDIEQIIPVEKRIAQKVGDIFDRNFLNNVEVKESSIPNVIN